MVDEMRSEGDRDPIDETKVKLAVGDDAAGMKMKVMKLQERN
jgi:hypothetical protein